MNYWILFSVSKREPNGPLRLSPAELNSTIMKLFCILCWLYSMIIAKMLSVKGIDCATDTAWHSVTTVFR